MSRTFRFISAGAGNGKTYRLAELLHDMLIGGRVSASGIPQKHLANTQRAISRH